MELRPAYKWTEVGVIPDEWELRSLVDLIDKSRSIRYGIVQPGTFDHKGRYMVRGQDYSKGWVAPSDLFKVSPQVEEPFKNARVQTGDLIITIVGAGTGHVEVIPPWLDGANLTQTTARLAIDPSRAFSGFCKFYLQSASGKRQVANYLKGAAQPGLNCGDIEKFRIPLPPTIPEQQAIAAALGDVDTLLIGLDRLIAKKRDLKQAAMQQLLTGRARLPGFQHNWAMRTIEQAADCFDGVRVPLNEAQRARLKGDYPYCGANGVLDRVSGYVIDDDIILMAEDGGYFDEYATRPIAYRMRGKCWVNNHAHILKAKPEFDQGFLFYSLVHKNILPFLASGTRAKLNKSEMNKIEVRFPNDKAEQSAIATLLSDMDSELGALEARRDKTRGLKQAMMQELLTGKIRLVPAGGAVA